MIRNALFEDDALAARYADVSAANVANAMYERPAFQRALGAVAGLDVLDAGCAAGAHSESLVERGARVVAVDASAAMVRLARTRLGARAGVLEADLAAPLPLAAGSFDLVASSLTLHYLDSWDVTLAEFRRLLRPRGRFVFSTHHPFLTVASGRPYHEQRLVTDGFVGYGPDPIDVRFCHRSLAAIVNEVVAAGFVLERLDELAPSRDLVERDPMAALRALEQPSFLIVETRVAS